MREMLLEMAETHKGMLAAHQRMLEAAYIYATTYRAMLDVYEGHLRVAIANADRSPASEADA